MKARRIGAPAFFALGAAVDFIFGWVKGNSVAFGLVGIVCGVPLTALLYFAFRGRQNDDSGESDE